MHVQHDVSYTDLDVKAPKSGLQGLFRALHSHNPSRYSHIGACGTQRRRVNGTKMIQKLQGKAVD